jgi:hypothetical protein
VELRVRTGGVVFDVDPNGRRDSDATHGFDLSHPCGVRLLFFMLILL